ncbi:hypothetical protein [Micromonospora halophytica]|uniref:Peptidase MA superfamily n=1 Tax=Micromonospora halophytica TaxID=47864 RepID=A0A1C5GPZ2_9ACTN|nr:hypothetical protein [Micromonospora halophytica]SCG35876.1 Peptidase MA superfamily [Micromonospora halophytica]
MTDGPATDVADEPGPGEPAPGIRIDAPPPVAETPTSVPAPDPTPAPDVAAGPAPGPAGRVRRRWWGWAALATVLVLLACGVPAALLTGLADRDAGRSATGRPSAASDDPATLAARRVAERLTAQLDRQAVALLGGDRAGFLAVADRGARAELTRRFAALRALRVSVWHAEPQGLPTPVAGRPGQWRQLVAFRYCLVVPDCTPSPVLAATRWREGGDAPLLLAVEESRSARTGARPWEVSELVVAVGARTVVATTPALRGKLPGLLAEAEEAAKVADRYAVAGPPPDRYRVFYAGRAEWRRWYGGGRPKWTAGYAVSVGGGHHEVVLNADALSASGRGELLRHELTHAASLPDRGHPGRPTWWLVEGLAEYAGADGARVSRYDGLDEVRRLVTGGWDGRLAALAPADTAPADRVGGSYGVGYLAVRHLVDRYGEQQVLAFFRSVVHDRRPVEEASEQVLGERWSTLHDECVGYVRSVAG